MRRVREEAGEREENLLAAPHPGEPVVDEGDPQLVASAVAGDGVRPEGLRVPGVDGAHGALPAEAAARARARARRGSRAERLVVEDAGDPLRDRLVRVGVDEDGARRPRPRGATRRAR